MVTNRTKILQYSNETEEKETNKVKQNFIIAFKIFLIKMCKDALNITIGLCIFILILSVPLLLIRVGVWLYHINIILGIISTPILIYLMILTLVGITHLDDIDEEIEQRKMRRNNNDV